MISEDELDRARPRCHLCMVSMTPPYAFQDHVATPLMRSDEDDPRLASSRRESQPRSDALGPPLGSRGAGGNPVFERGGGTRCRSAPLSSTRLGEEVSRYTVHIWTKQRAKCVQVRRVVHPMDHTMTVWTKDREIVRYVIGNDYALFERRDWAKVMRLNVPLTHRPYSAPQDLVRTNAPHIGCRGIALQPWRRRDFAQCGSAVDTAATQLTIAAGAVRCRLPRALHLNRPGTSGRGTPAMRP